MELFDIQWKCDMKATPLLRRAPVTEMEPKWQKNHSITAMEENRHIILFSSRFPLLYFTFLLHHQLSNSQQISSLPIVNYPTA